MQLTKICPIFPFISPLQAFSDVFKSLFRILKKKKKIPTFSIRLTVSPCPRVKNAGSEGENGATVVPIPIFNGRGTGSPAKKTTITTRTWNNLAPGSSNRTLFAGNFPCFQGTSFKTPSHQSPSYL